MVDISIIIPIYNGQVYVKKCMDMLLNSNNSNFEIIVINDGSTDGTSLEMETYKECQCIRYYEQNNKGTSAARNFGIGKAKGSYLMFVDIDDDIYPGFIDFAVSIAKKNNNKECIIFSKPQVQEEDRSNDFVGSKNELLISCLFGAKILPNIDDFLMWSVWSKIYKKELIDKHNISFNEKIRLGEDIIFNCYVFSQCRSVLFVRKGFYNYIRRSNSSLYGRGKVSDINWFLLYNQELKYLEEKNSKLWNDKEVMFWKNRYMLESGIIIIGKVCRASFGNSLLYRIKLIKEMTGFIKKSEKYVLSIKKNKDKTIRKLDFIDRFPLIYVIKTDLIGGNK